MCSRTDIPLPPHKLGLTSWSMCGGAQWLERDIPLSPEALLCPTGSWSVSWDTQDEGRKKARSRNQDSAKNPKKGLKQKSDLLNLKITNISGHKHWHTPDKRAEL